MCCAQAYAQTLRITNNLSAPVEGEVKPSSSNRWSVSPASFRVKAGEAVDVAVTLKLLKWAQKQKGVEQGQKDAFHIRVSETNTVKPVTHQSHEVMLPVFPAWKLGILQCTLHRQPYEFAGALAPLAAQ